MIPVAYATPTLSRYADFNPAAYPQLPHGSMFSEYYGFRILAPVSHSTIFERTIETAKIYLSNWRKRRLRAICFYDYAVS